MENQEFDCAIIGGGPGGLVSALYLKRFRRKVVLFNSGLSRASWIPEIHNLIGYDKGISGIDLLERLRLQVSCLPIDFVQSRAKVFLESQIFRIETPDHGTYRSKKVILATGITDSQPKIENLDELRKKSLLRYCSICDGFEFQDQPVSVIVQGKEGVNKALYISHWTKDLHVIFYDCPSPGSSELQELKNINAKIFYCRSLVMKPSITKEGLDVLLDHHPSFFSRAVYVELGCTVNSSAFSHLESLRRTTEGFLITDSHQKTSIDGIYALGDCSKGLAQISVAAGQAAIASTAIHNELLKKAKNK